MLQNLTTKIAQPSLNLVPEIISLLESGQLIVLPSDTTYAIVAHGENQQALSKIAQLKQWSTPQPLVILTREEKAEQFGTISPDCYKLMKHFPYPVTLAIPKNNRLNNQITGDNKYALIACPGEYIFNLIPEIPFPMVCTSASLSLDMKTTTFDQAIKLFKDKVSLIVDGGKSRYATKSTIIDFTLNPPTIMNFGAVSYDDLRKIIPEIELPAHLRK